MALTPKKRAFADALRGGASNKKAAIAAGYAASSAAQAGARLAKDPHVLAELARTGFNKNVKSKGGAKKQDLLVNPNEAEDDEPAFDLSRALTFSDPKAFLMATMNDFEADAKLRVDAAKALMPFIHPRKGEAGKKVDQQEAAKKASGRFGSSAAPPPPLRSVK